MQNSRSRLKTHDSRPMTLFSLVVLGLAVWIASGCGQATTPGPEPTPSTKGTLSGYVEDSSANIIGDVIVSVVKGGNTTVTTSDAVTGIYSMSNLDPGNYTLSAAKTGYNTSSANITVAAGENARNITLTATNEQTATLEVKVVDTTGGAVSAATVLITNETTSSTYIGTTETSGYVTFEGLPSASTATSYIIGAWTTSLSGSKTVGLPRGQKTSIVLTVESSSSGGGKEYSPCVDGYRWIYRMTSTATTDVSILRATISGTGVVTVESIIKTLPKMISEQFPLSYSTSESLCEVTDSYSKTYSGNYDESYNFRYFTCEAQTILVFPLNIGNKWFIDRTSTAEVVAFESVTVPAGTYSNCYRLRHIDLYSYQIMTTEAWYAPNVGAIKAVINCYAAPNPYGLVTTVVTTELTSKNF